MAQLPLQAQGFVTSYGTNQNGLLQQGLIGAQPGFIQQPGLIPQQGLVSQPLLSTNVGGVIAPQALAATAIQQSLAGQSLVGGSPYGSIGTTNQFIPNYSYNQGCFNWCPWWLWLVLGALLLGGLIAGLARAFGGNKQKRKRKQEIKNNNYNRQSQNGQRSSERREDNGQSQFQNHHLRYSVQWM